MITAVKRNDTWRRAHDGFLLCEQSLADLLLEMGIADTGISTKNTHDVSSYYDDWYLFRVNGESGLVKLREQEHDYVPGFADRDTPGVTVSFVAFPEETLWTLADGNAPEKLKAFVAAFRAATDLGGQKHSVILQQYFSDPRAEAPYLIADRYIQILLKDYHNGLPYPDGMEKLSKRLQKGIRAMGNGILDEENRCFRIRDPENPTETEKRVLLAAHSGNLTAESFAAEVKFHADALISPICSLPVLGRRWYRSAIRADLNAEEDGLPLQTWFAPYYRENSALVKEQRRYHG